MSSIQKIDEQVHLLEAKAKLLELQSQFSEHEAIAPLQDYADNRIMTLEESVGGRYVSRESLFNNIPEMAGYSHYDRPTTAEDTKDGDNAPFWRTLEEHRRLQGLSRFLASAHEAGATLVDRLSDYAVHTGMDTKASAVKDVNIPTGLLEQVNKCIDEIFEDNKWQCFGESDALKEIHTQGEVRVHVSEHSGGVAVEIARPEHIVEPGGKDQREIERYLLEAGLVLKGAEWKYGVASKPGRPNRILGYLWSPENTSDSWEFWPAESVVEVKINVPSRVKRGMSDFYPLVSLMRAMLPLATTAMISACIQASIALIQTDDNTKSGGVKLSGTIGKTLQGSGGEETIGMRPGQVIKAKGTSFQAGALGTGQAAGIISILQAGYRIVGNRWAFPEYASSGNASNANKSSSETAETPLIRSTEVKQKRIQWINVNIAKKGLAIHVKQGRFREHGISSLDQLLKFVRISCTAPNVGTKRIGEEIARDSALVSARAMSRQTLAERHDLEWEVEQERMEKEGPLDPLGLGIDDGGSLFGGGGNASLFSEHNQPWGDYPIQEETKRSLEDVAAEVLREDSGCGANAKGGGGFQKGNSCAKGGGRINPDDYKGVSLDDFIIDMLDKGKGFRAMKAVGSKLGYTGKEISDKRHEIRGSERDPAYARLVKSREKKRRAEREAIDYARKNIEKGLSPAALKNAEDRGMFQGRSPFAIRKYSDAVVSWGDVDPSRKAIEWAVRELKSQGAELKQRGNNNSWYGHLSDGREVRIGDHLGKEAHEVDIVFDVESPPTREKAESLLNSELDAFNA